GMGFPELIHVGAQANFAQKHGIGITLGNGFVGRKMYSLNLEYERFFGKSKKHDYSSTWYLASRLSYVYNEKSDSDLADREHIVAVIAVGRDFNFSSKTGLSLDFGYLFPIYERTMPEDGVAFRYIHEHSPTLRLQLFYRLKTQ
ncbi:hypothetical protein, partial [Fulvivirga aurantia]|uniref:hypothetical protein n=1 Tax=Fulvivirga aurantia TaxID=2529383 RepID=UPI0016256DBB